MSAAKDKTPPLAFREVDESTWPDFERLFESRGGPEFCWCMVWRDKPRQGDRKQSMLDRVTGGVPIGILGYEDGEPVAWCSIAPRDTYRKGLSGVDLPGDVPDSVWSLACFFVPRRLRGQGIATQVIAAAIEHARANGAHVVEAYPVDADAPSYRFMGFVGMFENAGFTEVGRAGTRRHVMRLQL